MPLPAPNLDDRRFQDIVDEAKRSIPKYCPEWTDHNVSDPGVALIELFAWMTESLLYRVNQVPEKNYIKFLEMIGLRLNPPRAASAPVTFYLSAPQPDAITIRQGTEVATVRTETTQSIIFTTEVDLTVRPPKVLSAYTQVGFGNDPWVEHDLDRLGAHESVIIFPNPPRPGDAFCLALEKDHSHHVISLSLGCKHAGGIGVDPEAPPLIWEVWQGAARRWVSCVVERDGTGGFTRDGEILLHLPAMEREDFIGFPAYWLRCRLTDAQTMPSHYDVSPELERYFRIEALGGTVPTRHAITVPGPQTMVVTNDGGEKQESGEIIGYSDGRPGQVFKLANSPVLPRNPDTDFLIVQTPEGEVQQWREVPDFAETSPEDRCYTLDSLDGTVTFGPALLQPDGSMAHFGAVPRRGSALVFKRYQFGGGVAGNVSKGSISILKSSIPYVAAVQNREQAVGGMDAQTLEDAKLRVAQHLRSQARAVTAEDFEFHARQVPGIARAQCLAPGAQPGDAASIRPGQVFLIVLPEIETPEHPQPEHLRLSEELRQAVLDYLHARCVLGINVEVWVPQITWISVSAELLVAERSHPDLIKDVQRQAEKELYTYLNPYTGGPRREGWPFGRDLYLSELYGLLQKIPSVEYVEAVKVEISDPGGMAPARPAPPRVVVGRYGVVCSSRHAIKVSDPKARAHKA
jgi:predicted phage baseplate assembly protein